MSAALNSDLREPEMDIRVSAPADDPKARRLTAAEAAQYLGISKRTLYNLNAQKRGPRRALNLHGELEYLRSDLDAWRAQRRRVIAANR